MSLKDDLIKELHNSNYRKRQAAARSMGRSGNSEYLPCLLNSLESEKNPEVKATVIVAIACTGTLDTIESIAPYLNSSNSRLRAACVKAMEHLGPPDIFLRIRGLLTDSDNQVITMVVKALWTSDPEALLGEIKNLLASPNKNHRKSAVWAVSELQYSVARPLLNRAIYDNSISVRLTANDVLRRIEDNLNEEKAIARQNKKGTEGQTDQLASPSQNSAPEHKSVISDSDHKSDSESAGESDAYQSTQSKTGNSITEKLATPARAVAAPSETSTSSAGSENNSAQTGTTAPVLRIDGSEPGRLFRRRGPSGFQELAELLDDQDPDVRLRVIKNIESSGESSMIPSLVGLLGREKNPHVIATLVKALGCLAGIDSAPHIVPFLESDDPRIVANTIEGLAFQPSMEIYRLLKDLCESDNPRIMTSAMAYCAIIDEDHVFDLISELLDSDDQEMQKRGIRVLGDIGNSRAMELLTSLYLGSSGTMRNLAGQTMESVKRARRLADRIASTSRDELKAAKSRIIETEGALAASASRIREMDTIIREMEQAQDEYQQHPPEPADFKSISHHHTRENQDSADFNAPRAAEKNPNSPLKNFPVAMVALFIFVILIQQYMIFSLRDRIASYKTRTTSSGKPAEVPVSVGATADSAIMTSSGSEDFPPNSETASQVSAEPDSDNAPLSGSPAEPMLLPDGADQSEHMEMAEPPDDSKPAMILSDEKRQALKNMDSVLSRLSPSPTSEELRKAADTLQVSFYMGELYVFERSLQENDLNKAVMELKKVRRMVAQGYILWDFEKGEWISPREE
jgi:HEAT repeat protein